MYDEPDQHASHAPTDDRTVPRRRIPWIVYAGGATAVAALAVLFGLQPWGQADTATTHRTAPATGTGRDPLAVAVSDAAGPGTDLAFSYGDGTHSAPLTLSGPTTLYVACSTGHFTVGTHSIPCDDEVHTTDLDNTTQPKPLITSSRGHWALLARVGGQQRTDPAGT
ncbi:hypothetical protein K7472_02250 [Streptomyces sp. PTM05]|uniref:Uncharacterized protein n=1 Tax=Streptantibioticus parmotrematis TaxID=2873249 RepID=A0ABS7QP79_9ACTN|nr:hypothetical protein [Streptantibioticus parmotrematis]MBY8883667.1 hypothetical protein [Streptantibioticus parmotrematis]